MVKMYSCRVQEIQWDDKILVDVNFHSEKISGCKSIATTKAKRKYKIDWERVGKKKYMRRNSNVFVQPNLQMNTHLILTVLSDYDEDDEKGTTW